MMEIVKAAAAAACCSGALFVAGCGFSSSPADGLKFQPPPTWQSSPGIMGFMQFWRPPVEDGEVLMLFKSPKPLAPNEIFSSDRVRDTLQGARIERRSTIQICGGQPATYIEARGSSSRSGDEMVHVVTTTVNGASYFAMYVRPMGRPPNAFAEVALRELCAKQ